MLILSTREVLNSIKSARTVPWIGPPPRFMRTASQSDAQTRVRITTVVKFELFSLYSLLELYELY